MVQAIAAYRGGGQEPPLGVAVLDVFVGVLRAFVAVLAVFVAVFGSVLELHEAASRYTRSNHLGSEFRI